MEWTLGITDTEPKLWKKIEPCWDDEKLTCTSSDTFEQVVHKLNATALAKRRGRRDHHFWTLQISTYEQAIRRNDPLEHLERRRGRADDSSHDEDSSDEESEDESRAMIVPKEELSTYEDLEDAEHQLYTSDEKVCSSLLRKDQVMHLTSRDNHLYLKVLSVKPIAVASLLAYFEGAGEVEAQNVDLKAVPAYSMPKEKQIDAHYPNFCKAFLGQYVPLREGSVRASDCTLREGSRTVGSASLGLSSRVRSDNDTTFCTMENSDSSSDLMYASVPFSDMAEFFGSAETAWTPQARSVTGKENLGNYRYSMVSRHLFPAGPEGDETYEHMVEESKSPYAEFGPKMLLIRQSQEEKSHKDDAFDFQSAFPKTFAQLQSGKFRWFKYKNGFLRVLVGRGQGNDYRQFDRQQVLRSWKRDFKSFHELLCAVEASWIYNGEPFDAATDLPQFDQDLGPSKPGPKKTPVLGKKEEAVSISSCDDYKRKCVTALAIVQEDGVLYSGHADGTLCKWSLTDNTKIWRKRLYADGTEDYSHWSEHIGITIKATGGVAGLIARKIGKKQRIYTWTHAYDGYPDGDFDERGPSRVSCWRGSDGKLLKEYECDVGEDEEHEAPAHPSVAAVVFCRLWIGDEWVDSMVVGMHCLCQPGGWEDDFSDFDLDEARRMGEGNILPFYEKSGEAMETWRGQSGIARALAVVPDQYLLSYGMRPGHGLPESFVLWDLKDPGMPLCRLDLCDLSRTLFKQNLTRLNEVVGISASGTEFLLAAEFGDRIAVLEIDENYDPPSLKLHGYGNIGNRYYDGEGFHGAMAMSGNHAAMAWEGSSETWVFNIEGNADHDKLDRRDGNPRNFEDYGGGDDGDEEAEACRTSGRELAIGKVEFPLFAGREKKKEPKARNAREIGDGISFFAGFGDGSSRSGRSEEEGQGGPVVLAMSGKWLVAGFANGSIMRAPHLPKKFASTEMVLGCCSWLPSDTWYCPELATPGSPRKRRHYDDDSSDEDDNNGCVIQ